MDSDYDSDFDADGATRWSDQESESSEKYEEFDSSIAEWVCEFRSEEVAFKNRVLHEVEWPEWKSKKDDSTSTWYPHIRWNDPARKAAERQRLKERKSEASQSLVIKFTKDVDFINERTFFRSQAGKEKLARVTAAPKDSVSSMVASMDGLLADKEKGDHEDVIMGDSTVSSSYTHGHKRPRPPSPDAPPPSTSVSRRSTRSSDPPPSKQRMVQPPLASSSSWSASAMVSGAVKPLHSKGKGKVKVKEAPVKRETMSPPPDCIVVDDSEPEVEPSFTERLQRLSDDWTKRAARVGAASVTFEDDGSQNQTWPLPPHFKFVENKYRFKVNAPPQDAMTTCTCLSCSPGGCECQIEDEGVSIEEDRWKILDGSGKRIFAYEYNKKLNPFFRDQRQATCVIECSSRCKCAKNPVGCRSAVAQRRLVPLTIFSTKRRGWGVKSSQKIPENTVIGVMTGNVVYVRRGQIPASHKEYALDLDGLELVTVESQGMMDAIPEDFKYTVDPYPAGNWARFINHSCEPNLWTYNVVFDTIPDMNMPYIAFFANRDIPAGEELTFDYNPKQRKDEDEDENAQMKCYCGTASCRGYV
ncbi:SET domain-containing protein [Cylindrobasidium torrendii FP15055 ss-10]|uniref:SET domain-containing protein n=1 Tax=Cylindrobasidium torrendii FP15055 ss-10 TaxID=1314674 RepID=A0A0D7B084_9AGAR|nr:SET domain-containing protein [Cylindrobasidium torrendii FP15055 ss-10]